ncbi:MAG: TIGR00153 family protein [Gammaproteobacteria bacterium]|jgi:predicted phosphate transport protein (TIGR00153 family)|nr:TIGR00153 family protein [Gammaproteobacteria bacterium]
MSNPIFSLFASSPFLPMQEHMKKVLECVQTLEGFMLAVFDEDWEQAGEHQETINNLEEIADDLKREIRLKLPDSLFMPVSRTDLIDLIGRQDRIANKAKDIANIMLGRNMVIPPPMHNVFIEFLQSSMNVCIKANQVIQELDELLETGFRGFEVKKVEALIFELDDLEDIADSHERDVRQQLFSLESDIDPVHVMFLYKVIDWIGEVANRAQAVGHRLHLMLAR